MPEGLEHQQTLAEVVIEPTAGGEQHASFIAEALEAMRGPELDIRVGPLSTTVIGTFDDIMHAVSRAHRCVAASAERVMTTVRIESKREGIDPEARDAEAPELQAEAGRE